MNRFLPGVEAQALARLAAEARRDLARLNLPTPNWPLPVAAPDGGQALDALVVGAGMCGQTAAFALMREGVRNIRVVDRAIRGGEGPWGTFARMQTLRSPKHLTGPDLGVPSLTFRAWYEAQRGEAGFAALHKAHRLDWLAYLLFVRDTVGIAVENDTAVVALGEAGTLIRADLVGPGGPETVHARQVILASGRDGAGEGVSPPFPSLGPDADRARLFHSADAIDFEALRGTRIALLGASASAFDNAATALEHGAAEAVIWCRRPHLPQVNKSRGLGFPGYQRGFAQLDDATRWRFMTRLADEPAPPPHESVLRCEALPGFAIRFGRGWDDVVPDADGVTLVTGATRERVDAVIFATGFSVDLGRRPELAPFLADVQLWGDRVGEAEARRYPELARSPYLDPGFALTERVAEARPAVARLRLFNHGATTSQGALAGDVPGLGVGAERVAQAAARALFAEDVERHYDAMVAFEEPELVPTPYFVPREMRQRTVFESD